MRFLGAWITTCSVELQLYNSTAIQSRYLHAETISVTMERYDSRYDESTGSHSQRPGTRTENSQSNLRPVSRDTDMKSARDMLIGALDRVIHLSTNQINAGINQGDVGPSGTSTPSGASVTLDDAVLTNTREATTRRTATSLGSLPLNQQAVPIASRPADCTRPELSNTAATMEEQAREHRRLFRSRRSMQTREHNFEPPKASIRTTLTRNSYKGKGKRRIICGARQPARVTWKKSCVCLKNVSQKRKPSALEKMDLAKMGLGLAELNFDYDGDALA